MTCIVGLVRDNVIWMGADSAGVSGQNIQARADEKIFHLGEFLIGFTTSFRMGQLIRYKFTPPEIPPQIELHQYMVAHFVEAIRDVLKKGGYAKKENEEESGGTFLVGIRGRLFCIESDYQVAESGDKFDATGSGGTVARSAMFALEKTLSTYEPRDQIILALESAEKFISSVRKPYLVTHTRETPPAQVTDVPGIHHITNV